MASHYPQREESGPHYRPQGESINQDSLPPPRITWSLSIEMLASSMVLVSFCSYYLGKIKIIFEEAMLPTCIKDVVKIRT